ncbi:hypothetical protein B0H21DRAFT_774205 [Amylocystis lapponica]|nr:hypothetical protein B0H21DRAFT_774205 [Amylocystis lapponica]
MLSPSGELLFWIPIHLRLGLWRPSTKAVIGAPSTKLDTTHFIHGTSWHQCHESYVNQN